MIFDYNNFEKMMKKLAANERRWKRQNLSSPIPNFTLHMGLALSLSLFPTLPLYSRRGK